MKRAYDSTVARIAGNVAGQAMKGHDWSDGKDAYLRLAIHCVAIARAIVAECQRTEQAAPIEAKTGVFSLHSTEPQSEGKPGTP